MRTARPVLDRLAERLVWDGDCLVWTGGTTRWGYGRIRERYEGKRMTSATHRVMYREVVGPLLGLCVLHHCDNPPCCNPEHLFLGTLKDNSQDMVTKGRARGRFSGEELRCARNLHEYTDENTYVYPDGRRRCRACMGEARRAYRKRDPQRWARQQRERRQRRREEAS